MKNKKILIASLILASMLANSACRHSKKNEPTNPPQDPKAGYVEEHNGVIQIGNDILITNASKGLGVAVVDYDVTKLSEVEKNISATKEFNFVNLNASTEIELEYTINDTNKNMLSAEKTEAFLKTYVIAEYKNNAWKEIGFYYPSSAKKFKTRIKLEKGTSETFIIAIREKSDAVAISNENSNSKYSTAGLLMSEALRSELSLDIMLYPSSNISNKSVHNKNFEWGNDEIAKNQDCYYYDNNVAIGQMTGKDLKAFVIDRAKFKFEADLQGGRFEYNITFDSLGNYIAEKSSFRLNGMEIKDDVLYKVGVDAYQLGNYKKFNNFGEIFQSLGTSQESQKTLLSKFIQGKKELLNTNNYSVSVIKEKGETITSKKIYEIQGNSFISPLKGKFVEGISGIVTAVDVSGTDGSGGITGFFLQDPTGDGDDRTSDAIFIKYINKKSKDEIKVGDKVSLDGTVDEYMSKANGLSQTQIINTKNIKVISSGNVLPKAIVLGVDRKIPQGAISTYSGDLNTKDSLNLSDGIDFYESIEGMLVKIENPIVTGASAKYKDIYVRVPDNFDSYLETNMGGLSIKKGDFNPEIVHIKGDTIFGDTSLKTFSHKITEQTGDTFNGSVEGVIKYDTSDYGGYFFINTKPLPNSTSKNNTREITNLVSNNDSITIASYNVENLYSTDKKMPEVAESIITNLKCPDIIGLIEIQDHDGQNNGADTGTNADKTLDALIVALKAKDSSLNYSWINIDPIAGQDGGAPGGNIRVAYIYNSDKITFEKSGDAGANDVGSVNSDGTLNMNPVRISPTHEAFTNSRKSLAAQFTHKGTGERITVIANHFNSKRGDSSMWGNMQPITLGSEVQRTKMATEVNKFIKDLTDKDEKVVVLGDFNAFYFEAPLTTTKGNEMYNLIEGLDEAERYTYNYSGNSQTLDHMLISKNINKINTELDIVHINSDFAVQISDHDPLVARITLK